MIRIALAGRIAQHKFRPRSVRWYHHEADHAQVANMIFYIAAPGEHANTYIRLLEIETRQMVDVRWPLIEALAHELVKRRTMSGREGREFIYGWWDPERRRRSRGGVIRVLPADGGQDKDQRAP